MTRKGRGGKTETLTDWADSDEGGPRVRSQGGNDEMAALRDNALARTPSSR